MTSKFGECPLWAKSGHDLHHSTTSSAIASTPDGMTKPSALAVFRLMTNSNLVDCETGRSEAFFALENSTNVDAGLPISVSPTRSVAHETASRDELASLIDRRQFQLCRPSSKLFCPRIKELASPDNEGASWPPYDAGHVS